MAKEKTLAEKVIHSGNEDLNYTKDVKKHINNIINKISFNNGYYFEMIRIDDIIEIFKEECGELVE